MYFHTLDTLHDQNSVNAEICKTSNDEPTKTQALQLSRLAINH